MVNGEPGERGDSESEFANGSRNPGEWELRGCEELEELKDP